MVAKFQSQSVKVVVSDDIANLQFCFHVTICSFVLTCANLKNEREYVDESVTVDVSGFCVTFFSRLRPRRPCCKSECGPAQVCTNVVYGDLHRNSGFLSFLLPVPGLKNNDTAEAVQFVSALRENRGLFSSCSTVRVYCNQHEPSLRSALVVEYMCTYSLRRPSWSLLL